MDEPHGEHESAEFAQDRPQGAKRIAVQKSGAKCEHKHKRSALRVDVEIPAQSVQRSAADRLAQVLIFVAGRRRCRYGLVIPLVDARLEGIQARTDFSDLLLAFG